MSDSLLWPELFKVWIAFRFAEWLISLVLFGVIAAILGLLLLAIHLKERFNKKRGER